jgi:hypothetical protein
MNEQIEKIYGEACIHYGDLDEREFLEKFAELIVRECGVALSPMLRDMVSRGQAYDLIKQHFGVTE